MVELLRVNTMEAIVNSDKLVVQNAATKRAAEIVVGLKFAENELLHVES